MSTQIKERQILFSGAMVRALLAGTKTQTRRIMADQPPIDPTKVKTVLGNYDAGYGLYYVADEPSPFSKDSDNNWRTWYDYFIKCPYGKPGERLWVRESLFWSEHEDGWCYQADNDMLGCEYSEAPILLKPLKSFIPSIHMPRVASRILLEVVSVRVERLNDCSAADAVAEGIEAYDGGGVYKLYGSERASRIGSAPATRTDYVPPIESYKSLWETINGENSWQANPWVWVVEFRRVEE